MKTVIIIGLAALLGCSKSSPESNQPAPETAEPEGLEASPVATETGPETAEMKVAPNVGNPAELLKAPNFTLPDQDGNKVSLSQFKGKIVVLEWFNPGCPFVKYAHGKEGPLKDQAARLADDEVVWLAINSGAPGKQGHGLDLNKSAAKKWGMSHPILFDEDGTIGKLYGAKTTPHMYIVNGDGNFVYKGALDDAPLGHADGEFVNYVDAALDALKKGEPIAVSAKRSYGCSVKYAK